MKKKNPTQKIRKLRGKITSFKHIKSVDEIKKALIDISSFKNMKIKKNLAYKKKIILFQSFKVATKLFFFNDIVVMLR